jgi:tetratricopeptide (TPR) repeat protein
MLKIISLYLLFFCYSVDVYAARQAVRQDSLHTILGISNRDIREKRLVFYLRNYFAEIPPDRLPAAQAKTNRLLQQFNITDREGISSFISALCLGRQQHFNEAENALVRTIALADKSDDDCLLYASFTHLGFIQTYMGNITGAVSSFRMAKKAADQLDDPYMQVIIDINISDIYYRIKLFSQALFYLHQAQKLMAEHKINVPKTEIALINNIAECYFRMGNIDSLKKYNQVLHTAKPGIQGRYVFQQRTDYYLDLLQHKNSAAINRIQRLRTDSQFTFDATDEQNLADAYFQVGQLDSAKVIIGRLLTDPAQNNHPEVKSHLFEVLGLIAEKEQDYRQAASNFKQALLQAEEQIGRLTRVDTISSQIKIDELQGSYIRKTENYKRVRTWMGFAIIVAVLGLVIVALSYRNIKRKKYYEQLLFAAKKEELVFINSHEVRRHLSNITGIIDTIKQSEDRHQAYIEAEGHLLSAAENLDMAIKNISAKLEV